MKRAEDIFRAAVQPALLLLCIGGLSGCSIIGFAVGAGIDHNKPDNDVVKAGNAGQLESGDHIRVTLVDSSVVEGIFKEFAPLDSLAYALNYERFLQHADPSVTFPRLGDTLEFTTNAGISQQWNYIFRGYGLGTLEVQRIHQFYINDILLRHLSSLENRTGVKFDPVMLERMSDTGQLPRALSVVVQTKLDTVRVPLDDIRFIEKANSMNAKWIGLGAGMAVDAIILLSISNTFSHMSTGLK